MEFSNTNVVTILNAVIDDDKEQYMDFDEKVEAFITEQGVKSALKEVSFENPFNTASGQLIASQSENFMARLARHGRFKTAHVGISTPVSVTASTLSSGNSPLSPSAGNVLYPTKASCSMSVNGVIAIAITTGIAGDSIHYYTKYVPVGGGFYNLSFDGDVYILPGGSIACSAYPDSGTSNGKFWSDTKGIEVAQNV